MVVNLYKKKTSDSNEVFTIMQRMLFVNKNLAQGLFSKQRTAKPASHI